MGNALNSFYGDAPFILSVLDQNVTRHPSSKDHCSLCVFLLSIFKLILWSIQATENWCDEYVTYLFTLKLGVPIKPAFTLMEISIS